MKERFRMSGTSHHLLTTHHCRRNRPPESSPNALKAVLTPAIGVNLDTPRKRPGDPHRDQILILEEVISSGYQLSDAIDLPQ